MITQQLSHVITHPMNRNYQIIPWISHVLFSFHGLSAVSWPLRPRTPSWSAAAAPGRWRRHRPHQPRYWGDRRCLRNICEKSSCLGGKFEGSNGNLREILTCWNDFCVGVRNHEIWHCDCISIRIPGTTCYCILQRESMDNMFISNRKRISLSEHPGAAIKQPQSSVIQCKTILVVMDLV